MANIKSSRRKSRKPRKSRRKSRRKFRSKKSKKIAELVEKKCVKWLRIPRDQMGSYDVSIKKCRVCDQKKLMPYLVHNVESCDYDCYQCGKDVSVRYLCHNC